MANPWRTIADAEVDVNSPIKEQLIEALYYNPLAAAEGVAGATRLAGTAIKTGDLDGVKLADGITDSQAFSPITTDKFADNVVNQGDCTTTSQELQSAINPTGSENLVFNDQAYYLLGYGMRGTSGLYFNAWLGCDQNAGLASNNVDGVNFTTMKTFARVKKISGASGYVWFKVYYINASPPYDIGHGQVAGFIYAKVKSNGDVEGVSISQDPPWYRSPCASQIVQKDGVDYCRRRRGAGSPAQARQTPEGWAAYLDAIRNPVYDEILMDNAFKNENMDRFPHPGIGSMDTGDTMVLIEPSGDLTADIMSLYNAGDDPSSMILRGDIKIKPGAIAGHKAPRGVIPVRAEWR